MIVEILVVTVLVPLSMVGAIAGTIGLALFYLRVWRWLRSTMTFAVTDDRILYWPVALAIVWPLLFALLWLLCEVFWLELISEVLFIIFGGGLAAMWVASVIVASRLMIRWVAVRHWRMVLSTLILPLSFLLMLLSLAVLWNEIGTAANYVKFFPNFPSYFAKVGAQFPAINAILIAALVALLMTFAVAIPIGVGYLCLRVWQRLPFTMTAAVTDNRILYWPAALMLVWPLLVVLLWLFFEMSAVLLFISKNFVIIVLISLWFLLFAGLGLASMWVGSVAVACRLMVQWALARHWRMVLSTAILPLTFSLVLSNAPFLWKEIGTASEYVAFSVGYPLYLRRLEERTATKPWFAVWADWPYDDHAVLYDETDEIAADHQSEAWKKKAKENGVVCCQHRHILDHFYYVTVDLP